MNENVFLETEAKLLESDILRIEEKLTINLPEQYRTHLLKYNGGRPVRCAFSTLGVNEGNYSPFSSGVHYFYAIYEGKQENFETKYNIFKGRMPANMIPIASDGGGNQICVSVSGNDYGHIYFWDHEDEADDDSTPDYSNLTHLADSLNDFIQRLEYDEDDRQ
jgi:cell wall assembly regulator SMI1